MNSGNFDLIIVGGGPAGLSAGLYAKRSALKTILVEKSNLGGQVADTARVENYLGIQSATGAELAWIPTETILLTHPLPEPLWASLCLEIH
jgi:thioredoxin reductase